MSEVNWYCISPDDIVNVPVVEVSVVGVVSAVLDSSGTVEVSVVGVVSAVLDSSGTVEVST